MSTFLIGEMIGELQCITHLSLWGDWKVAKIAESVISDMTGRQKDGFFAVGKSYAVLHGTMKLVSIG
jgi:hypothetical protein